MYNPVNLTALEAEMIAGTLKHAFTRANPDLALGCDGRPISAIRRSREPRGAGRASQLRLLRGQTDAFRWVLW